MGILRLLLLAFNVAIFTFLVYRLMQVYQQPGDIQRKRIIILAGVVLLIVPVLMITTVIPVTPAYLFIYPVAVSLFVYLIRDQGKYS